MPLRVVRTDSASASLTMSAASRGAFIGTSIVLAALLGVDRDGTLRAGRHLGQVEHPVAILIQPPNSVSCSNSRKA
jgi:hypothetical protein